ncbi:uncharacterized protein LOC112042696 [Lingula anatina]|uniref:Uncharacterized protein LOC112042696 n=1 Tax=Lingula anatina TaxID=7574 RepID=A0A2R2MTV8_LINAN|nr:uncharacterized protein LOC112042696 [Lingula anatina]|eukprot:XP_023933457.1 uncharacterized protein LOC112042696 [Lingula anatina]
MTSPEDDTWQRHYNITCLNVTSFQQTTSSPQSGATGENDTVSPTASYHSATGTSLGTAKYIANFTLSPISVVTGESETVSPTASYPSATGTLLGTAKNADNIKSESGIDSNKPSQQMDVIIGVTVPVIVLLCLAAIIGLLWCMKKKSRRVRAEDGQAAKSAEKENGS